MAFHSYILGNIQNHRNLEPEGTRNAFSLAPAEAEPANYLSYWLVHHPHFFTNRTLVLFRCGAICLEEMASPQPHGQNHDLFHPITVIPFSFARDCFRGGRVTQFCLLRGCYWRSLGKRPRGYALSSLPDFGCRYLRKSSVGLLQPSVPTRGEKRHLLRMANQKAGMCLDAQ